MFGFDGALSAVECARANGGCPTPHLHSDGLRCFVRPGPAGAGGKAHGQEINLQRGSSGERGQMSSLSYGYRHAGFHDKIDMLFRAALMCRSLSHKRAALCREHFGCRHN
jgi:hypothetical protein